ncbi:hypothetical protein M1271_00400 [Patescibacteria group bacterium]|nr:hypothetical protein [Patescibacteria group bacterium]
MEKIKIDKIGSVLKNVNITNDVSLISNVKPMEGESVVVKVLAAHKKYGELELVDGRMYKMREGDIVAGALGERKALEGIVGVIPKIVSAGDRLNILNLGAVVGQAVSWNKEYVSAPVQVEVLGSIYLSGRTVNIHNYSLKNGTKLQICIPLIIILGTSMGVGKTTAAAELIHALSKKKGLKVAAAKLTGVATQRDMLAMKDAGAIAALTFHDVGLTSTLNHHGSVVPATKTILNTLAKRSPDVIVVELGDGIVGWYGVDKLLNDPEFLKTVSFTLVCAQDLTGAYGAINILEKKGLRADFFSGPVTNNTAGTDYLESKFGIPSQDLREDKTKLLAILTQKGVVKND